MQQKTEHALSSIRPSIILLPTPRDLIKVPGYGLLGRLENRRGYGLLGRRIFKRPFTPRGWLQSARNFGKTRFRRFPTFHFSTPKNMFGDIFVWNFGFFPKMPPLENFSTRKIIFAESSETRFPKVSRQSEPSSRGKRPFEFSFRRGAGQFFFFPARHGAGRGGSAGKKKRVRLLRSFLLRR